MGQLTFQVHCKTGLTSEGDIVEVSRCLDGLNLSTDVELLDSVAEVCDGWVSGIVGAENVDSFLDAVGGIDVLD
jgi:hypothetical protein